MINNKFVIGGLYEWVHTNESIELCWAYHNESFNQTSRNAYPLLEKYVVLNVKNCESEQTNLVSVKVLSTSGVVGRLYMHCKDWKQIA